MQIVFMQVVLLPFIKITIEVFSGREKYCQESGHQRHVVEVMLFVGANFSMSKKTHRK